MTPPEDLVIFMFTGLFPNHDHAHIHNELPWDKGDERSDRRNQTYNTQHGVRNVGPTTPKCECGRYLSVLWKTSPYTQTMLGQEIWWRPEGQSQNINTDLEEIYKSQEEILLQGGLRPHQEKTMRWK